MSGTLTALFFAFISCSDNDNDPVKEPETDPQSIYDLSKVTVSDVGYISASEIYSKILKKASEGNSEQDQILLEFAQEQLDMVKGEGAVPQRLAQQCQWLKR